MNLRLEQRGNYIQESSFDQNDLETDRIDHGRAVLAQALIHAHLWAFFVAAAGKQDCRQDGGHIHCQEDVQQREGRIAGEGPCWCLLVWVLELQAPALGIILCVPNIFNNSHVARSP